MTQCRRPIFDIGRSTIAVIALGMLFCGCEDLPELPASKLTGIGGATLRTEGAGGTPTTINAESSAGHISAMKMDVPVPFSFWDKLDRQSLVGAFASDQNAVSKNKMNSGSDRQPDWMDDDVYSWFQAFRVPEANVLPTTNLTFPIDKDDSLLSLSIDSDGRRLLALGSKLQLWSVDSNSLIKSLAVPAEKCMWVSFLPNTNSAILHNGRQIFKISLDDGRIEASVVAPDGDIASIEVARDVPSILVASSTFRLDLLDESLAIKLPNVGSGTEAARFAISVNATWGVTWSARQMSAFTLDRSSRILQTSFSIGATPIIALAGSAHSRLFTNDTAYEHVVRETESLFARQSYFATPLNWTIHAAAACETSDRRDWTTVVMSRVDASNSRQFVVQDVSLFPTVWSEAQPIGDRHPNWVGISRSGDRVAMAFDDSVQVIARKTWLNPSEQQLTKRIAGLLDVGRFEQLERCAKFLRSEPFSLRNGSGESLLCQLVNELGELLSNRGHGWTRNKSELSVLVSAAQAYYFQTFRDPMDQHRSMSLQIVAGPQPKASLARLDLLQDLEVVLKQDTPPLAAYVQFFRLLRIMGKGCEEYEHHIKRSIELYAAEPELHAEICHYLLHSEGHFSGECEQYMARLMEGVPPRIADDFFGRVLIALSGQCDSGFIRSRSGLDISRAIIGLRANKRFEHMGATDLTRLFDLVTDFSTIEDLALNYVTRYPLDVVLANQRSFSGNFMLQRARLKMKSSGGN